MTIFGEYHCKFDINAHNFRHSGSNFKQIHFLIGVIKTFRAMYILFGSTEAHIFPLFSIVFGNDVIMTLFLVAWYSDLRMLWNIK